MEGAGAGLVAAAVVVVVMVVVVVGRCGSARWVSCSYFYRVHVLVNLYAFSSWFVARSVARLAYCSGGVARSELSHP